MYKLFFIAIWSVIFALCLDLFISSGVKHVKKAYKDKLRANVNSLGQHLHGDDHRDFVDEILSLLEELLDISRSTIKVVGYVLGGLIYLLVAILIWHFA